MVISQYTELTPPYDHEAEAAVIGALLIDDTALAEIASNLRAEDFHRARNQYVYEAILTLRQRLEAIDQITVARELAVHNRLDAVGGLPYLGQLVAQTPTSVNADHYAAIVADTAAKRRLIDAGHRIAQLAFADDRDADAIRDEAVAILTGLRANAPRRGFRPLSEAYDTLLADQGADAENTAAEPALTGLHSLDGLTGGLAPSDLIILGARPGFGKSSLALNALTHAAGQGRVCGIFSLEMNFQQVAERILAADTGIPSRRIRHGIYSDAEADRVVDSIGRLSGLPVYIDDTPAQTAAQMLSKSRQLQLEHGLDLLAVDYLQLMAPPAGARQGGLNQVQAVSHNSQALKTLARDLHIPVICCSQLSRAPESRPNHRPMLADLRDSGSIEQDADLVLFLYRLDKYQTPDEWAQTNPGHPYPKGETEVIVAKHRHGPTGTAHLYFDESTTAFYHDADAAASAA